MYKKIGDLVAEAVDGQYDVIVHGCNCQCTMGSGIAAQIKEVFPEAYDADLQTKKGDKTKLGCISTATYKEKYGGLVIVNGYTQFNFGGGHVHADYEAIRSVFKLVKEHFSGKSIGIPMIGAGLAKGDWNIISKIIDEEMSGEDITLVMLRKDTDLFYTYLARDAVNKHEPYIEHYKIGKLGVIGLFTAQAMKDTKGTADPARTLKAVYDHMKNIT